MKNPCYDKRLLHVGLSCGAALLAWAVGRRLSKSGSARSRISDNAPENISNGIRSASKYLNRAAGVLALSVLADSGVQHYGACYFNRAMYIAPTVSALVLAESAAAAAGEDPAGGMRACVFSIGALAGLAGTGFHLYNIAKRQGSLNLPNFFYGAPIGAPGAIFMAGALGAAGEYLSGQWEPPAVEGKRAGRALAGFAAFGIAATVAEAFLYHLRGAFQDPFQYVPVTVPVASAVVLLLAAVRPSGWALQSAALAMKATAIVGLAGPGFHAYGVHRNMGGWSNWRQMILQGPPLTAPLGFTGMAFAGMAALPLLESD